MTRWLVLIGATFELAACQSVGSAPPAAQPPLVQYSRAQQQKLAAELRALQEDSFLDDVVTDYGKLRDAVRAGRK